MSADAPRVGVATAVGVAFAVQAGVALVIFAPPVSVSFISLIG